MKSIRRKGTLDGQVDPAEGLREPWKWPNLALRRGGLEKGQLEQPRLPAEGVEEGEETPWKSVFWAAESAVKKGMRRA